MIKKWSNSTDITVNQNAHIYIGHLRLVVILKVKMMKPVKEMSYVKYNIMEKC